MYKSFNGSFLAKVPIADDELIKVLCDNCIEAVTMIKVLVINMALIKFCMTLKSIIKDTIR